MPDARKPPAFLFDLDGTLVDSVYQHVVAWREALKESGIDLSVWRIHRRIGMSGGLLVQALLSETGVHLDADEVERLQTRHAELYTEQEGSIDALPGASTLLAHLTRAGVPWIIATSGRSGAARPMLAKLGLPSGGYGREELERAGAFRVYEDPATMLHHLHELGVRV